MLAGDQREGERGTGGLALLGNGLELGSVEKALDAVDAVFVAHRLCGGNAHLWAQS